MTLVDQMSASYIQKHAYSSSSLAMQTESSRISEAKSSTEHASAKAVTACARRELALRFSVDQIAAVAATVVTNAVASTSHGIEGPRLRRCSSKSFKNVPSGRKQVTKREICAIVLAVNLANESDLEALPAQSAFLRRYVLIGTYSESPSFVQSAKESTCQTVSGSSSKRGGVSERTAASDILATVTCGRNPSESKNSKSSQNAPFTTETTASFRAESPSGVSVVTTRAVFQNASVPVKRRSNSDCGIRERPRDRLLSDSSEKVSVLQTASVRWNGARLSTVDTFGNVFILSRAG